jgi:hypothetical protein
MRHRAISHVPETTVAVSPHKCADSRRTWGFLGTFCLCLLLLLGEFGHAADESRSTVSGAGVGAQTRAVAIQAEPSQTGLDPDVILPPAWAFGVLHGYYTNEDGVRLNLRRLLDGDFPVDAIWVDSAFWDLSTRGPRGYLDFKGDQKAFPNLRSLTTELEKHDVRFGIWVWDRIMDANSKVFQEFKSRGYFTEGRIVGDGWHNAGLKSIGRTVDFANPAAAALWSVKLRPFLDAGVDFFKIDAEAKTDYLRTHFELATHSGPRLPPFSLQPRFVGRHQALSGGMDRRRRGLVAPTRLSEHDELGAWRLARTDRNGGEPDLAPISVSLSGE